VFLISHVAFLFYVIYIMWLQCYISYTSTFVTCANYYQSVGALKSREWTRRECTRRHEETWVDNAGVDNARVSKHEQQGGMSRNHTEERQQLNAPITHAPLIFGFAARY